VNQELLHLLDQISREKGIDKPILVEAVLSAVLSAARKRMGPMGNLQARLDDVSGAITLFSPKRVVLEDDIIDDSVEISLEEAATITPTATLGQIVDVIHELEDYGRSAAQTAKQVIIQKVREAERETIFNEFIDRQGELVNGVVARVEREGNLVVDLGRTEALLPRREQSFRETFKRNDRIRAYIIEVKKSSSGPQVILSRTHPGFLMRLFEMEVPEIYENIVEIKEAARDASGRAKIAVMSNDDVDPVGACVGIKGMRVQSVVQELRGEKIDIIPWTEDQVQFVRNALSPAKVARVYMNEDVKTMQVVVPNDQLSLAIGKRGQNVRLAAKLTHWKIDIMSEDEADADGERLEALRRAQLAFSIPKRSAASAGTDKAAEEEVSTAMCVAEIPATESEGADKAAEEEVSTATCVAEISEARSEDSVDAAVAEETVSSAGSTQSSEPSVAVSPTESFEETLLDRDDPERLDEAET
jgi:N utilization substance protein A